MNEAIMEQAGFGKEVEMVKKRFCPGCGAAIHRPEDFRNEISRREYRISGLCQKCQDQVFGKD